MRLNHRVDGPEDAPVVVLASSIGTTLEMWDPQVETLARAARVVRYDHPGHGGSEVVRGPLSMEDLGRGLLSLLDELGVERFSFCGLSLGGAVGQWLGVHAAERLDRLVLCCTASRFGPPEGWNDRARIVRARGTAAIAEAVLERWFTEDFRRRRPEEAARWRAVLEAVPAEGYAAGCEAIRDFDLSGRLGAITAPTLVIAGADDPATPPSDGRALADGIPGARLEVVERAAHLANIEQPEAVGRAIAEHLA
jgi:3-oxoadipate enol-lactonase